MSRKTKGIETSTVAIIIIIILVVFAAIAIYFSIPKTESPTSTTTTTTTNTGASLGIQSFSSPYLFYNRSSTISVVVSNNGDSIASNVTLALTSDSLPSSLTSSPQTIAPSSSATFTFVTASKDIKNGMYALTIAASFSDLRGPVRVNLAAQQLTVMPTVAAKFITWQCGDITCLTKKNTIGGNDSTQWHFEVQSLSQLAQYAGLTAQIVFQGDHTNMTVSPNSITVATLGPNGPSPEYIFTIQSHNAPDGDYKFNLIVSYLGIPVASYSDIVYVK